MKKIFLVLLAPLLLMAACDQKYAKQPPLSGVKENMKTPYTILLEAGNKKIAVQVVSEQADMNKGLSGRSGLSDEQGMLFDFKNKIIPSFWMKDMLFDLDLIWIADGKIIGITAGVPAPGAAITEKQLPTYRPPSPADQVLEVRSGWTKKYKIKTGDEVRIK